MGAIDAAKQAAGKANARVVFPEMDDPRIIEAAKQLEAAGLARIIELAPPSNAQIAALQSVRPVKEALAKRMLKRPLIRAAAMVKAGEADVMVAGISAPTKRVIEAASLAIGLADGCETASSFFLMSLPNGSEFIFADCALNVAPNAAQLTAIATASAHSAHALFGHCEVALLSYSTGTSGAGDSVNIVRDTAKRTGFRGPVQADAALNQMIAAAKGCRGENANTLIFPSLDAGNIAYKLMQELAGAQAIGPILQGFCHPVCDLSRGASVKDIIDATLLTIALGVQV